MEPTLPVLAKKAWNLMRVMIYMLRKGIPKTRLFLQLNMIIKRGKKLMFHHHHNLPAFTSPPPGEYEYEFSCSNTPSTNNHTFSLFPFHKKHQHTSNQHAEDLGIMTFNVLKAIEMIHSDIASPELHGFVRSPVVRELRVTDSPFPVSGVEEDSRVDDAAERFISQFYSELRRQNTTGSTKEFGSR